MGKSFLQPALSVRLIIVYASILTHLNCLCSKENMQTLHSQQLSSGSKPLVTAIWQQVYQLYGILNSSIKSHFNTSFLVYLLSVSGIEWQNASKIHHSSFFISCSIMSKPQKYPTSNPNVVVFLVWLAFCNLKSSVQY